MGANRSRICHSIGDKVENIHGVSVDYIHGNEDSLFTGIDNQYYGMKTEYCTAYFCACGHLIIKTKHAETGLSGVAQVSLNAHDADDKIAKLMAGKCYYCDNKFVHLFCCETHKDIKIPSAHKGDYAKFVYAGLADSVA